MFLQLRTYFLLQGYSVLILNYRGSTGYGEDFMNALLGHIGDRDVHDCGQLAQLAIKKFAPIVDENRVAVYGASHGGFLTGWLIGHPDYKHLWKSAVLWNPVINMSYMWSSTDIPDWILACCLNKAWTHRVSSDDNKVFWDKSPISVVQNVTTPSLVLIGE
jgi:acylaminoacyl-peptidase